MAADSIHPSDEVRLIDPGKMVTGTALATEYELCRGVHCGVTGTYRVYGVGGVLYSDLPMVAGGLYPYMNTKITTTGGAATGTGEVFSCR